MFVSWLGRCRRRQRNRSSLAFSASFSTRAYLLTCVVRIQEDSVSGFVRSAMSSPAGGDIERREEEAGGWARSSQGDDEGKKKRRRGKEKETRTSSRREKSEERKEFLPPFSLPLFSLSLSLSFSLSLSRGRVFCRFIIYTNTCKRKAPPVII